MAITVVRLGTARLEGEGVRIGTVRRPPRGVSKSEFASRDFFDVWMPMLAPSEPVVTAGRHVTGDKAWEAFVRRYRAEMKAPDASRLLDLLAALSHGSHFSVGCYCEHEQRCHRSVLRDLLVERGAHLPSIEGPPGFEPGRRGPEDRSRRACRVLGPHDEQREE